MTFDLEVAERRDKEFDLMCRVISIATDVVNEVKPDQFGNSLSPSLGNLARLADAVHAHWKFQRDGQ